MGLHRLLRNLRTFGPAGLPVGRAADRRDGEYASSASPVIVGGCGRSGTTLLRVMLDSHRNLCCGPESELLLPHKIRPHVLAERFDMPPRKLASLVSSSRSRGQFIERFFAEYAAAQCKPRWAEKTPANILHLDYLFEAFPSAKVVHMIRDGRDVACSLRTHPRHKVVNGQLVPRNTWNPLDECIGKWVDAVRAGQAYRGDERYMEMRYEELVAEPRSTLERLMQFLGEPWDEAMLQYDKVESTSRDVTKFPQNPEARRKVETRSVQRWRSDLSEADVAMFKAIGGELLVELCYERSMDW